MNLLVSSTHPAEAGLQSALVELLLDHGAAIDGLANDSSPMMTAFAFGYREAAETLMRRGAKISSVSIAAGLGRLDLVRELVVDRETLARMEPLSVPYWVRIPPDAPGQIALSLVIACRFGRPEVAEYLLDLGVAASSADADQMTALHWASATGMIEIMKERIARGAPLEVTNVWGGTVLDSTVYFALNHPYGGVDYPAVIEMLLAAGADVDAVDPAVTGNPGIDAVLQRYRDS